MLRAAGFTEVHVEPKLASKDLISQWLPGSGAEDFVVSANITANKPAAVAAHVAPSSVSSSAKAPGGTPSPDLGEAMPARLRAKLEAQEREAAAARC